MEKSLLITRPEHDLTTLYISKWSEKVIDEAKRKKVDVIDLHREKANKNRVAGILKKKAGIKMLVIFNGHGNADMVTGHDNEPLVTKDNADVLSAKIVYARSCQSAKVLGKTAVAKGCLAYLGYQEDFIFLIDEDKITKPLEDAKAALFLEPSNYVINSLLKGHSAIDANNRSKNLFRKNLEKVLTGKNSSEDRYAARFLYWDMTNQVCLGDGSATF